MFALLMVEDTPDFPALDLPDTGTAYGGIVLVHMGRNIGDVYDRAVAHGADIVKPYGPSRTGRSMTMLLRAPPATWSKSMKCSSKAISHTFPVRPNCR